MIRKFLWIAAVTGSLVLAQSSFADSCRVGLQKMIKSLDLDDAQKAKITPILEQMKASKKDDWSQMKDLDSQINQQVTSDKMDQAAVDSLVDKKTKLIGSMMKTKLVAKNQIFTVLNAKQKTELQNMMTKADEKMAEKFKNCHDDD